ncbi:WD repeat protein [Saccharata proteae CBS 121410]|uniref:WD repeat protein n=1 Tax=Saccharata proteae CBS 121410 TaxID=1314787 RepID=A0A9P4HR43_9PEZI|nr:WD repeat protein [Saccharata proteae CBS 121410]
MSRSSHPGHFFQTSTALSESARKAQKAKNASGNPIKLPSKLLAAIADPLNPHHVYVAEAAGKVRHVALETRETAHTFSGPAAPLTSLAIAPKTRTLLAGCWDKSIWAWSLDPSAQAATPRRFANGHTDFVKSLCVTSLGGRDILFSGGADATICTWDVGNGALLYKMKGHKRGVLSLAVDPEGYVGAMARQAPSAVIWSAGSDREIRAWRVSATSGQPIDPKNPGVSEEDSATLEEPSPLLAHETSVDSLLFDASADLWTASADRTARCLSRAHGWSTDTTLNHPDYVRDVVVDEVGGYVITACRDEHVRVWERGSGKLVHVFEGHYEEVTSLVLVEGNEQKVVSVGIDGTVRQWSLKAADLQKAIEEAESERKGEGKEEDEKPKESLMTEDEERELAELMEDDD